MKDIVFRLVLGLLLLVAGMSLLFFYPASYGFLVIIFAVSIAGHAAVDWRFYRGK